MQIPGEKCCTILASAFSKHVKIKLDSGEKMYNVICASLPPLTTDNWYAKHTFLYSATGTNQGGYNRAVKRFHSRKLSKHTMMCNTIISHCNINVWCGNLSFWQGKMQVILQQQQWSVKQMMMWQVCRCAPLDHIDSHFLLLTEQYPADTGVISQGDDEFDVTGVKRCP